MKKIVLLFISLILIASASNIKIDTISVGGKSIKIPEPLGLKEISSIKVLEPLVARFGGSKSRVLGAYVPDDYIKTFPNIKSDYPDMWAIITVSEKNENIYVTLKKYKDIVEFFKNNNIYKDMEKTFDDEASILNKGLKEDYGFDFNLTLNVPKTIPNQSYTGDSYYSYISLMKMEDKKTVVSSTSILHIYHRIITINIYKVYHSKDDIINLKKESKKWLDDIVKLNKKEDEITCDNGNLIDCYGLAMITAHGDDGVQKDETKALELFTKACDGSHAKACYELGKSYLAGRGAQQDNVKARKLFNKACDAGSNGACYNLGAAYGTGSIGVKQDNSKASKFYQKACDKGDAHSCFNLGSFYSNGLGVKQDYLIAIEYYTKACDGKYLFGCNNLGMMYKEARGVKKDYSKALGFFQEACNGNHAQGCFNLGTMYYFGQGVNTDMQILKELMFKSCQLGHKQACINYKTLK